MPNKNVLITGGNGFIAVHIIVLLLQLDYRVTATVRSESKATYLRNKFSEAVGTGQLKFAIVEDITTAGAFDEVFKDNEFDAVLHTSSPLFFNVTDIKKEILLPAINGTLEILKGAKRHAPTVKRVVITSSFAALAGGDEADRSGYVYNEKDWSSLTFERAQLNPSLGYRGSKALAEKSAWNFVETEKPHFDLVTICPPMVYGPVLQEITSMKNLNASSAIFYSIFSGQTKELVNHGVWLWVDVRDVAQSHIAAIEKPEAGGRRFLVSEGTYNIARVADYIWEHYPERALAKGIPKSTPSAGYPASGYYTGDNSASKNILGMEYRSFENSLRDQLAQFVAIEKEIEEKRTGNP